MPGAKLDDTPLRSSSSSPAPNPLEPKTMPLLISALCIVPTLILPSSSTWCRLAVYSSSKNCWSLSATWKALWMAFLPPFSRAFMNCGSFDLIRSSPLSKYSVGAPPAFTAGTPSLIAGASGMVSTPLVAVVALVGTDAAGFLVSAGVPLAELSPVVLTSPGVLLGTLAPGGGAPPVSGVLNAAACVPPLAGGGGVPGEMAAAVSVLGVAVVAGVGVTVLGAELAAWSSATSSIDAA